MADIAKVSYAIRETLLREIVYKTVHSVISERLVGDGLGYNARAFGGHVVREVLIKIPAIQVAFVLMEALVSKPSENLTQARIVGGYQQSVILQRDPMAPPSTVKSLETVAAARMQVILGRTWEQPRSSEWAMTMRMQVVQKIVQVDMRSSINVGTLAMLVARSRDRAYTPESAAYTFSYRQQVAQHRIMAAAPAVRSPVQVGALVESILQSRRVVVGITDIFAATLHEQVLQETTRPAPISQLDAMTLAHLVLQRHTVTPPGIDDRVAMLVQQVVLPHAVIPMIGMEHVGGLQQLVISHRPIATYRSAVQLATFVQQSLQHAFYPAPGYLLGWRTYGLKQQILAARAHGPIISHSYVSSLRVAFVQRRVTPPPAEVIDPSVGRHTASLRQLTLQHRVTLPPEQGSTALFVLNAMAQLAIGDQFPPPDYPPETSEVTLRGMSELVVASDRDWAPVSVLRASSVIEQLAVGDAEGWPDATIPHSEVQALQVLQELVAGDVFLDPFLPLSAAEVSSITQSVAVGDVFLDPTIPQSVVLVDALGEQVAIGDTGFPDPSIPTSAIAVLGVREQVAIHDDDLTGKFTMSTASAAMLIEFVLFSDPFLVGIPARPAGPRPVVTIAIS